MIAKLKPIFLAHRPLNAWLIAKFDESRLRYMLFWFPVYQIFAVGSFAVTLGLFGLDDISWIILIMCAPIAIFVWITLFASWYLSGFLFLAGYFGLVTWLGFKFCRWPEREILKSVEWFRQETTP